MQGATADYVPAHAANEQRVLVTTDTDFDTILAPSGAAGPSVMLLRVVGDSIDERVDAILHVLSIVKDDLSAGAVAVVETDRIRLRHLPIDD